MHPRRHRLAATLLAIALGFGGPSSGADLIKDRAAPDVLIAAMQSPQASLHDRARACQIAGETACTAAVPALAALLDDAHLAAYARSGLENIPDPSAAAALRTALGMLTGDRLRGVIDSLGALRDPQAVPALTALAQDAAKGVAPAALAALGRIACDGSVATIRGQLASTDAGLRAAAAEAGLLAAERRRITGDLATARAIYDACRAADVPTHLRSAATCGAIVTRGAEGVPLLMECLAATDRELRRAGLRAARILDGSAVTAALAGRMQGAQPAERVQLIAILADRGGPAVAAPIAAQAGNDAAEVRSAAIQALARLGDQAGAPALLGALGGDDADAAIAMTGLAAMKWDGLDALLLSQSTGKPPAVRAKVITVLADRRSAAAVPAILAQTADADPAVATAAFKALGLLARPDDMDRLIAAALAAGDDNVRTQAERAIGLASQGAPAAVRSSPVLKVLERTTKPADRALLLRVLGVQGSPSALATVQAALTDGDEQVRDAAFRALAAWPDATPMATMMAMAKDAPVPAWRILALRAGIRMVGTEADTTRACGWLAQLDPLVKGQAEKCQIIAALAPVAAQRREALALLAVRLGDGAVAREAAVAVVGAARAAQAATSSPDPALLKSLLERVVSGKLGDDRLRQEATRLGAAITVPAVQVPVADGPAVALFDGRTLDGWEGNLETWRVADGVILGGSLAGNPRNEFLASRKEYGDFVLRFAVKIIGTKGFINGGMQIRSQRIAKPANEMTGYQVDIGAGYSGALYDESRRNKVLARPDAALIKRIEKADDWNQYEVVCQGPRIIIRVNGELTVDYTETDAKIPLTGRFGMQVHGNCQAEIRFKDLTIQELPPAK